MAEGHSLITKTFRKNFPPVLLDSISAGIAITDRKGYIHYVNESLYTLFGYQQSDLIGQHFTLLVPYENYVFFSELNDRLFRGDFDGKGEWKFLKRDLSILDIQIHSKLIEIEGQVFCLSTILDISEQSKMRQMLDESLKATGSGGWELDLINHKLSWTWELYSIYEIPTDTPLDIAAFIGFHHDEDQAKLKELIKNSTEKGSNFELTLKKQFLDGRYKWLKIIVRPTLLNGRTIRLTSVISDITLHADAFDKIKQNEQRYRSMFELNPQPMIIYHPESLGILDVNKSAEVFYGFSMKDFLKMNILDVFDKEEQNHFLDVFIKNKKTEKSYRTWKHLRKNSKIAHVELFSQVFGNEEKKSNLLIINDITSQKFSEEKLKEREEWFHTIFNSSRDGTVVEMNEHILYANKAFVKLYGYGKAEELLGKKISVIHAKESDAMMLNFGRRRLSGEPTPELYEAKGVRKDGSIIDIEVSATVFTLRGQRYIIAVNRDITERKSAEITLKERNEQLIKTNAELDRFVYSASHDLKAPLSSVLGLINIALMEENPAQKDLYMQMMVKSISKLQNFVKDIVNYSRNSRLQIRAEPIDFTQLFNGIIDDLRYMEEAGDILVNMDIPGGLVLYSDKNRLNVIFNNIISNAIRYSRPEEPNKYINIIVRKTDSGVSIDIKDNGIGIPETHRKKIFEMFYRANENSEGTGLGLYIVQETISVLGGRVEVQSAEEKGTTFTVYIPDMIE